MCNVNWSIWSWSWGRQTLRNGGVDWNCRGYSPPEKTATLLSLVHGFQSVVPWAATSLPWKHCWCSYPSPTLCYWTKTLGLKISNLCLAKWLRHSDAQSHLIPMVLVKLQDYNCRTSWYTCPALIFEYEISHCEILSMPKTVKWILWANNTDILAVCATSGYAPF